MDANDLGALGLTTATVAMPLLLLAFDQRRRRGVRRQPVPRRIYPSTSRRYQAHRADQDH